MLFGITVFVSAFLLFQIQLIAAKQLLPWFGGAPAVWTTCQLFFQTVLLGGYAYAHLLSRVGAPKRQCRIHLVVLLLAVASVAVVLIASGYPILAPEGLRPDGSESAIPWILLTLGASVGVPFFVLSATGPLLQHWHSRTGRSLNQTYRLYALSNAGSLIGLISYPFGFEPLFELSAQAWIWTALFALFVTTCGLIAWRAGRSPIQAENAVTDVATVETAAAPTIPERFRPWLWLALSITSSSLFLSTTNQLCQEVAVIPFLWVLPLTLYLLSFIICFDRPQWYSRRWFTIGSAVSIVVILPVSLMARSLLIPVQLVAYAVFLSVACMVCHGELARLRPQARQLTLYYLLIAVGGALGGVFVSLIAPVVFTDMWEFHTAVLAAWVVWSVVWWLDRSSALETGDPWLFSLFIGLIALYAIDYVYTRTSVGGIAWLAANRWSVTFGGAIVAAVGVGVLFGRSVLSKHRLWPTGLIVMLTLLSGKFLLDRIHGSPANLAADRNFYGVIRVIATRLPPHDIPALQMAHGNTTHGYQFAAPAQRRLPTAYFSPSSGLGFAMRCLRNRPAGDVTAAQNLRLGILGMGVGTIATYALPGDHVRYYEINPLVTRASEGFAPYFTFIRDCAGEVSIAAGDARLCLDRELQEAGPQKFDLLAMDAFTGDAVPVHLLTEEAFRLYVAHLRGTRSILAVNITNRHLNLEPVVAANARKLGLQGRRIDSPGDEPSPESSSWILLAQDASVFATSSPAGPEHRDLADREVAFTDRYSNLFRILK